MSAVKPFIAHLNYCVIRSRVPPVAKASESLPAYYYLLATGSSALGHFPPSLGRWVRKLISSAALSGSRNSIWTFFHSGAEPMTASAICTPRFRPSERINLHPLKKITLPISRQNFSPRQEKKSRNTRWNTNSPHKRIQLKINDKRKGEDEKWKLWKEYSVRMSPFLSSLM